MFVINYISLDAMAAYRTLWEWIMTNMHFLWRGWSGEKWEEWEKKSKTNASVLESVLELQWVSASALKLQDKREILCLWTRFFSNRHEQSTYWTPSTKSRTFLGFRSCNSRAAEIYKLLLLPSCLDPQHASLIQMTALYSSSWFLETLGNFIFRWSLSAGSSTFLPFNNQH